MEIFSIVDKINVDKLNTKIAEFVSAATGIVSSFKTFLVGKYQGNKMFEDDTLKFGEIELR